MYYMFYMADKHLSYQVEKNTGAYRYIRVKTIINLLTQFFAILIKSHKYAALTGRLN